MIMVLPLISGYVSQTKIFEAVIWGFSCANHEYGNIFSFWAIFTNM